MTRAEKRALNKARHVNRGAGNQGNGAGRGGPAKGAGGGDPWGGPARGASASRILPGDPDGIQRMSKDPDIKARNEARNVELKEHLYHLAKNAEREETQLSAAVAWLDRDEGKPIARSVTTTVDDVSQLSDLELTAEIARLERELGEAAPRAGEAEAGKPPGGVPPIH